MATWSGVGSTCLLQTGHVAFLGALLSDTQLTSLIHNPVQLVSLGSRARTLVISHLSCIGLGKEKPRFLLDVLRHKLGLCIVHSLHYVVGGDAQSSASPTRPLHHLHTFPRALGQPVVQI